MKIISSEYTLTAVRKDQYPVDDLPQIVLLGRSNVGKSSFINSLLNKKNLAYTSSKPGKTQALNFFKVNDQFYFVDVPGYGYAKKSAKQIEAFGKMVEEYLTENPCLKRVFLILDIRHKPSEDDITMYDYLKYYHLPVTIIATKLDKIGTTLVKRHMKVIEDAIELEPGDKIIPYSSFNSKGLNEVLNHLDTIIDKK